MSDAPNESSPRRLADTVARRSYSKLVAYITAQTRNVAAAEDALSEAFAAALSDWPVLGCPENPEAWLLTVARRRAIDVARRRQRGKAITAELRVLRGLESDENGDIPDRRLELMFACAHPAVPPAMRAPLMLQVILGLKAATIASAFLVAPATMGQRLVRAKRALREADISFRVPEPDEFRGRLDAVLDAIYAAYGEGWADASGTEVARHGLAEEALFLGTLLKNLMPDEPEVLGLLALMLHAEARRKARRNGKGEYVPLAEQNRERWDAEMINIAEALLQKASTFNDIGRYQLEAALQSAQVHRTRTGRANWNEVIALYDALYTLTMSPVVSINRALAVAEVEGPQAALDEMPDHSEFPQLSDYQPYWAARADLLGRTGSADEAHRAYQVAIGLEKEPEVRHFLLQRQARL